MFDIMSTNCWLICDKSKKKIGSYKIKVMIFIIFSSGKNTHMNITEEFTM